MFEVMSVDAWHSHCHRICIDALTEMNRPVRPLIQSPDDNGVNGQDGVRRWPRSRIPQRCRILADVNPHTFPSRAIDRLVREHSSRCGNFVGLRFVRSTMFSRGWKGPGGCAEVG